MEIEHIHLNNWGPLANAASDHDPVVTKITLQQDALLIQADMV